MNRPFLLVLLSMSVSNYAMEPSDIRPALFKIKMPRGILLHRSPSAPDLTLLERDAESQAEFQRRVRDLNEQEAVYQSAYPALRNKMMAIGVGTALTAVGYIVYHARLSWLI